MEVRFGVLTVSDRVSRGEMEDEGGIAIESELRNPGWTVAERATLPDEIDEIAGRLIAWADDSKLDVIFTTGGTGLGPRDVTPEATLQVAERIVPGIAETIRALSLQQTPQAMISRGTAAVRGTTLIINLPGSPRGAREGVEIVHAVLEHAVAFMHGGRH